MVQVWHRNAGLLGARPSEVANEVLLQSIPVGSVSDIYWLDNETVVFGTTNGVCATLPLDPDDLVAASSESLIRGLTPQECLTYRIDRCTR